MWDLDGLSIPDLRRVLYLLGVEVCYHKITNDTNDNWFYNMKLQESQALVAGQTEFEKDALIAVIDDVWWKKVNPHETSSEEYICFCWVLVFVLWGLCF